MKLAVLIGWNGSIIGSFIRAARETNIDLKIKYPRLDPVDDDFINFINESDAVFIHHFSGESIYSDILSKIEDIISKKDLVIAIDPVLSRYSKMDPGVQSKISDYYFYGGYENIKNMLLYIKNLIEPCDYEEPKKLPFSGIYNESTGNNYKGSVGILFYRTAWADNDTMIVDALIKSLEDHNLKAIPVFTNGFGDKTRNIESAEECIKKYFLNKVDAVINMLSFSLIKENDKKTLIEMNVPVFQALIYYYKTPEEWLDSSGLDVVSTIMSAMIPEMDGTIEPIIIGAIERVSESGAVYRKLVPLNDQIIYMVKRIENWINLRRLKNNEKKIAIILHSGSSFKDLEANIGTATGLDTLESVVNILKILKNNGYDVSVPENGGALVREIMSKKAIPEGKWTSIDDIINGNSFYKLSIDEFNNYFNSLPEYSRKKIIGRWGILNDKRDYMVMDGNFIIPGLVYKNVFIGVQPKRITYSDDVNSIRSIHDSETPVTYYWLAFYYYIGHVFKANAIIHVGTHGTLEFTPGKGLGLSGSCFPEISIGTMPHIYLYSTNVPGEGIIAKRRSYAVLLDYITPPTAYGDIPDDVRKLEDLIDDFEESEKSENKNRSGMIIKKIEETCKNLGLDIRFDDPGKATHEIEHRLNLFKDSITSKGLYTFASSIDDNDLIEYVSTARRFEVDPETEKKKIINYLNGLENIEEADKKIIENLRISGINEERNLLMALSGNYIETGPSGSLARGRYDVIPSGRNFYAVDPFKIPTRSSFEIGRILAEKLIKNELEKNKKYPETLGFILWSTDIYRSDGELVSQILYTLGLEPVWQEGTNKIKDVVPVPIERLGRPRIDVVIQASGIVRDNLFNIIELIDTGINKIAALNEGDDVNYIKKHYRELNHLNRIFSSKPGSYGSGVSNAVESSSWKSENDLADVFIEWMGYSYGRNNFGTEAKGNLISISSKIESIVHKREIDEIDIMDDSCNYSYAGGFFLASKKAGANPNLMFEDTFNPSRPRVRTMSEEIERTVVMKLLNDDWISSQKKFGYRGATEMLKKIEHLYGWAATTKMVNDRIFDRIADKFSLNDEMKNWFKNENPWAYNEITSRLIEANKRGIWNTDNERIRALEESYIEMEGETE
ncbi:cobaltochelatase subunit CobN [Picrophilus oshimae]|uniref:CobN protein n=1 Tax=Picrophilus torridus (strain ATCC 700027 / DSM 9790 / JCM 10055 / NBRC 100828 / KAW 2/3) TaxID=1122961 RepID=Q6L2N8_PICTO|nr:cobaltochelatase subunit CobN [Picrophilus oshimae]AAT42764.1 CobN protein [Picrophilus oshimae DSM 9789]